jgi:hypothetical protein
MALITPPYLTEELAKRAVEVAHGAVFESALIPVKRGDYHIVILVPCQREVGGYWEQLYIEPYPLYEQSFGEHSDWATDYQKIARDKARQRWYDQSDGGAMVTPHLLFPGNTKYWGAVKRECIVAACSGVQPEFDRLMAQITVDTLIALALHEWKNDTSLEYLDFLPSRTEG